MSSGGVMRMSCSDDVVTVGTQGNSNDCVSKSKFSVTIKFLNDRLMKKNQGRG